MARETLVLSDITATKTRTNLMATSSTGTYFVVSKSKQLLSAVRKKKYQNCTVPLGFPWVSWGLTPREANDKCITIALTFYANVHVKTFLSFGGRFYS